ncbi:nitrite reductase [candidate division KSB1 bacterium]|nr:nitrite reductase [candidate division KSB1 bacterium]
MKFRKSAFRFLALILSSLLFLISGCSIWSNMINRMMPADSRPYKIQFSVETLTPAQFEQVASDLKNDFGRDFGHIRKFREQGIRAYEGPKTCLTCHKEISVKDHVTEKEKTVKLMDNLLSSSHYTFFTTRHPNVYGFNGKLADNFPMGKIDRPCPKPGSFAMTAWAELVVTEKGDTLSEGCGQCHIGGQYQAPLGSMMPGYEVLDNEQQAIDCLICHSNAYDMNKKVVVNDASGNRWGQDRSMRAAMAVTKTTSQMCLRCHQHNFGGDIYIDTADPSFMQSMNNTGNKRPRVLHPGSKRGTPFSPTWDVHAAAGVNCTDCHITEGHLIAKGTHTTTMMANDLPDVEINCEKCHTNEPHSANKELADYLNSHVEKIACQTCHIPSLHPDNATMRDFAHPKFEEHPGIYVYDDMKKETAPGKGIGYMWWNGDATFLGNPIGDNPNGEGLYRFYNPTHVWPEFKDFDYAGWYENVMRPIARKKSSKLYMMKYFNGRQHIDLQNIGPFGGMFVPYNLPTYYTTGNPDEAAKKEMEKSMMKMMYGFMFDKYLMDKFMTFMDVDGWNTKAYDDVVSGKHVEPRWLPADAMLEISHSIRKDGALTCGNCHSPSGVLDWKALGYTDDEIDILTQNPLE